MATICAQWRRCALAAACGTAPCICKFPVFRLPPAQARARGLKMESLCILVPLSIAPVFLAIRVFFGASDSGQFDDLVGPGLRVPDDDDRGRAADKSEAP